jgi:nucleotide-binding universal stress UspA family protein
VGKIVVGVDGSPGSLAALRFALAEARLHDAVVVALHVWSLPLTEMPGPFLLELAGPPGPSLDEVTAALTRDAEERLDQALQELASEAEGIEIERRVTQGAAAAVLVEASRDAELLVVGTRGRGGFKGLLLGSVSQQCVSHSSCPVVTVPAPHER